MTPRILGLNLSLDHTLDAGARDDFSRALQPAYTVVMVDGAKDIPKVLEYQAANPYTTVIGRVFYEQDGGMHLAPQAPGDADQTYTVSPLNWINAVGSLGQGDGWCYVGNEPSGHDTEENLTRLVSWTEAWMQLALIRGVKSVLFNFGDRHPKIINGQWETRYRGILRLASQHPNLFMVGLHAYGPDSIVEHLAAYVETCAAIGVKPPRVVLTEFGLDTHEGSADGYKARDWSGVQYAGWMERTVNGDLRPYIDSGVVAGANVFCWNSNPRWQAFDVQGDGDWQKTVLDMVEKGRFDIVVKPITKPTGQYIPKPPDAKWPKEWVVRAARTMRSGPNNNYPICTELARNDVITLFDFPGTAEVRADGLVYTWKWVESAKGNGWVTVTGWGLAELKPTVEVPAIKPEPELPLPPAPEPQPPPAPPDDLPKTRAELQAMIDAAVLKALQQFFAGGLKALNGVAG